MRKVLVGVVALSLVGCATSAEMDRLKTYDQEVQKVVMPDDTYRLYVHKTENALAVSPSLSKIMAIGAAQGATLGVADTMTPEKKLEAAALKYLSDSGKADCRITRGYMLKKPIYEFWYECDGTAS